MSITSVSERLEQWDSELAALSIVQTNSIVDISRLVAERPYPPNLIEEYSNKQILDSINKSSTTLGSNLVRHAFSHGEETGILYDVFVILRYLGTKPGMNVL
ncbi:hypothetical protein LOD99_7646 [Oopsacas minuta]|uniref:Uncharacterized protein n=1 Tax=Oopsacas minuta TaxID=111878 RepID=A0AAV7JPI9_9METZ|nr:hypothetical protein LOD99_7646 [Oopsacas minuta]